MKNKLLLILLLWNAGFVWGQNSFQAIVRDSSSGAPLVSVTAVLQSDPGKGASSDLDGKVMIGNIPDGQQVIQFSYIGFHNQSLSLNFPLNNPDTIFSIVMSGAEEKLEEITVAATRTNSRIEDLPTRVEVLGQEDMQDENYLVPSNIASIIGDFSGIQIQQTSAVTSNDEVRIQGLQGKYTQILRDGLPLYGDFAASFNPLQIPPVDLQQIELIKGASSTLYGGGAIAGLINLVSRKPALNEAYHNITLNQTSLKETTLNGFFSARNQKIGYSLFAGGTLQQWVDVNKDGFSDLPDRLDVNVHPRVFFYFSPKSSLWIGNAFIYDESKGGDIQVLDDRNDPNHSFFIGNKNLRNAIDFNYEHAVGTSGQLQVKGLISYFNRNIATNTFNFKANQTNWFTEVNWSKLGEQHQFISGFNFTGDIFRKVSGSYVPFQNYDNQTLGIFVQDDWHISSKFTTEAGLRYDYHFTYGSFVLPRLSLLYKASPSFTFRLGGGAGYKTPTLFSAELDERDYQRLLSLDTDLKAETSLGANFDVNFHKLINGWSLTINQSFFYTRINDPLLAMETPLQNIRYENAAEPILTKGTETYVRLHKAPVEIYLGYNFTDAIRKYDEQNPLLPLIAKHKFATLFAYDFTDDLNAGVEGAFTGYQRLDDGTKTPSYFFLAASVKYRIKRLIMVLNGENILDFRQTKKEAIVLPPFENPTFRQLYAPIEGRVLNLSFNYEF